MSPSLEPRRGWLSGSLDTCERDSFDDETGSAPQPHPSGKLPVPDGHWLLAPFVSFLES